MRTSFLFGSCALCALGAGLSMGTLNAGCVTPPITGTTGGIGGGGTGGGVSAIMPGEVCVDPSADTLSLRFSAPTGTLQNVATATTCKANTDCPPDQGCAGASSTQPGTCMFLPKIFLQPCPAGPTPCQTQQVRLTVDPDTCVASDVQFTTGDPTIAPAPAPVTVSLHQDQVPVLFQAGPTAGVTTITATVFAVPQAAVSCATDADCKAPSPPTCHNNVCTQSASSQVAVQVVSTGLPACSKVVTPSTTLTGGGPALTLGAASIALQAGANDPDMNSFLWGVPPLAATLAIPCGVDLTTSLTTYQPLGPAVTFGPESTVLPREIPMSIPINPALMPIPAFLRHVRIAYSGPGFKAPRVVPVADLHIAQVGEGAAVQWALTFKAPRLGTYQAVIAPDAGTKVFSRRMTHRAVMGISMGGGGTATFGMRHHDRFDVLAPLGGPVDWTWMLDYIAENHLGGFRPIPSGTTLKDIQLTATPCMSGADCQADETCLGVLAAPVTAGKCVLMPKVTDPYAHPQTFNTWWYEYPRAGNGGTFDRQAYAQIFRDLALMYGNPNSDNFSPGGENLPAGVPPTDPSVVGNHPGSACAVTIDPVCPTAADGTNPDTCPSLATEQELVTDCPTERCAHTLTLQNYFDDEYNPDGIFPVITVCDGGPQNQALTPYSNTWTPTGDGYPLEVGLAVDYNGNGVRDELEPIIRAGHENWLDYGADGIPSSMEPGYAPGVNDDPNGDDYQAQYNPSGTEGDHRFTPGEHFDDFGLDGVKGTAQQPATGWAKPGDGYDVGEGDGQFTVSRGLQRFWDRDAHSIVRQMVDPANVPGGILDDEALARIDMWTDGGLRDLFNFDVDAQHLVGAFSARGRLSGYLTSFTQAPGLDPTLPPDGYDGKLVDYDAMPGIMLQRYGEIDPSANDINDGSGQHVGSASEIVARLESALYFIGSRWKDRTELFIRADTSVPAVPNCTEGSSSIVFPSLGPPGGPAAPLGPSGRRGPVGISLPPGYCSSQLQQIRYPVVYLLHGYGQSPQDLEPTIVLLQNFMNDGSVSTTERLVKAIIVYVDGRCRTDGDVAGAPAECLRGTFFADSVRKTGAQDETWWLELMDYMDQNYRTLGETQVNWVE